MRVFWAHGYDRTSIHDLTAVMGVNPPSLYAAFGDKRRLFAEATRRYQAKVGCFVGAALDPEGDAREAVERLLDTAAAVYTDPDYPPGCMVAQANVPEDCDTVAADLAAARRQLAERITQRIQRDRHSQNAENDEAVVLGRYFAAVLHGMSAQARDGADQESLRAVARQAIRAWPNPTA
ncbi:TetR/AcrR family transcriptional regulator [Tabrizicola sp.]|uniref:TetR/AcrR family transcriptional regulator n=1 Tax=Tabrizicola sp. TaxID=2005166 RepID=UPI003F415316